MVKHCQFIVNHCQFSHGVNHELTMIDYKLTMLQFILHGRCGRLDTTRRRPLFPFPPLLYPFHKFIRIWNVLKTQIIYCKHFALQFCMNFLKFRKITFYIFKSPKFDKNRGKLMRSIAQAMEPSTQAQAPPPHRLRSTCSSRTAKVS